MKEKHLKEFERAIINGDVQETDEGLLVKKSAIVFGRYTTTINDEDPQVDYNLLPAEGIRYMLMTSLAGGTPITNWYVAIYSGAVSPAANWTAANFAANATEITSNTEGYSNTTRPAWTPGAESSGVIGNLSSRATFNIVCSTTLNIAGAAVLSSNTKGGTTGTLISATRYGSARVVNNGDSFGVGYEIGLTDS